MDYTKTRNYWKYLKVKLKKEDSQLVCATTQLKLTTADGKQFKYDVLDYEVIIIHGKIFHATKANRFVHSGALIKPRKRGKSIKQSFSKGHQIRIYV